MQPAFPPIGCREKLEQPKSFLTEVFEFLRINLNLEDLIVRKNPTLWVKGGKAVIGENCFRMAEAVWVHVCSTLLCMTPSGFLFWEAWVDLRNGPVQTAPEMVGKCMCVCVWAHICMCMFASVNRDMGYGVAFAFEACIAKAVIS